MRSGTTFLANLINAQEGCVLYRDFLLSIFRFSSQLGVHHFNSQLSLRVKNVLLANLKSEMRFNYFQDFAPTDFTTLGELYQLTLNEISEKTTRLVGVKVTQAEDWIGPLIQETDTLILVVIRDLRDVLLSAYNRFSDYRTFHYALSWVKGISITQTYQNCSRVCVIRFEDLITRPRATLAKVGFFLGVYFPNTTYLKDLHNTKWTNNSAFHDVKIPFDSNAVYRWKSYLDSKKVKYAIANYGSTLVKLGYVIPPLTFKERIRFRKQYYVQRIPRLLKRLIFH